VFLLSLGATNHSVTANAVSPFGVPAHIEVTTYPDPDSLRSVSLTLREFENALLMAPNHAVRAGTMLVLEAKGEGAESLEPGLPN